MDFLEYKKSSNKEKFVYFFKTVSFTNKDVKYYVDFDKVIKNVKKYELELNTLNYLVGKNNIYEEALELFTKQPNLIKIIPILLAYRYKNIDFIIEDNINDFVV